MRHLPRVAVNTTYELARDADVIYASDPPWWRAHLNALRCTGIKVAIEAIPKVAPNVPDEVMVLRNTGREGFDINPACLRTIENSGAQAIQVAAHAGAARILLYGFDMHGGHWHGPHVGARLRNPCEETYERWIDLFRGLAAELRKRCEVINCTPGSRLDCFPTNLAAAA